MAPCQLHLPLVFPPPCPGGPLHGPGWSEGVHGSVLGSTTATEPPSLAVLRARLESGQVPMIPEDMGPGRTAGGASRAEVVHPPGCQGSCSVGSEGAQFHEGAQFQEGPCSSPFCCSISITTSCYPLPSICVRDPVSDWFESLAQCLHWNVRKKQAHFPEDEEDAEDADEEGGEERAGS